MPFHFLTPRTSLKISPKLMWIQSGISWDTEIPINLSEERGEIILPCPLLIPEVFSCFFSLTVFARSESEVFSCFSTAKPNGQVDLKWGEEAQLCKSWKFLPTRPLLHCLCQGCQRFETSVFFSEKINISTTGGSRVGFFQPDTNHP